jgi:hypothetical protein
MVAKTVLALAPTNLLLSWQQTVVFGRTDDSALSGMGQDRHLDNTGLWSGPGRVIPKRSAIPLVFNHVGHRVKRIGRDPMRHKMARILLALGTLAAALVSGGASSKIG